MFAGGTAEGGAAVDDTRHSARMLVMFEGREKEVVETRQRDKRRRSLEEWSRFGEC